MLTIEKIERIEELLEQTGQETMNAEEIHGLLTAIACGPVAVPPDQWMPLVFLAEEGLPETLSGRKIKELTKALTDFYGEVAESVAAEEFAPLVAESEDDDGQVYLDPSDWCCGFMVGARFAPDAWHDESDTKLLELLAPIVFLSDPEEVYAGLEEKEDEEKQEVEEEFLDRIAEVVPRICAHFKEKYPR